MNKAQTSRKAEARQRRRWLLNAGFGVLILGMVGVLVLVAWVLPSRRVAGDYEGVIVERWADYAESNEGSRPYFRLMIKSDDGKQFVVRVDPGVYESARVGMRIKNRSGQIVLIESNQTGQRPIRY